MCECDKLYYYENFRGNIMNVYSKLIILDDGIRFFGPGVCDLLKGILETNSIKDAAKNMGLSYSKALRILKKAELYLGFNIVIKSRGGETGGETIVTDEGKRIIESYDLLYKDVNETIDKSFPKYFAWLEDMNYD